MKARNDRKGLIALLDQMKPDTALLQANDGVQALAHPYRWPFSNAAVMLIDQANCPLPNRWFAPEEDLLTCRSIAAIEPE
jgi:hypothetical protein